MTKEQQIAAQERITEYALGVTPDEEPSDIVRLSKELIASLRAEPSAEAISIETREVERRFDLNDRARAARV